jgi:hypothetical protein
VIEDPSDKKCNVKLVCYLANMCPKEQGHMFCYEGGKDFKVMMISQHVPYMKLDPKRNIGRNTASKFAKNLMTLTGVPNPRNGKVCNAGICRDGIGHLVKHKVGEAVQKSTAHHEPADIQAVCHADCRMYAIGRTTGQVGSVIKP